MAMTTVDRRAYNREWQRARRRGEPLKNHARDYTEAEARAVTQMVGGWNDALFAHASQTNGRAGSVCAETVVIDGEPVEVPVCPLLAYCRHEVAANQPVVCIWSEADVADALARIRILHSDSAIEDVSKNAA